jgi:selenium donor protein
LTALAARDGRVLVGPETADDAGVYLLDAAGSVALVATADFITPLCDDPRRFGRVAAANSLSDVYAMGGEALFALNLCCFPEELPDGVLAEVLAGAAEKLGEAGAALLGGHTVRDPELKFGLAVIGRADPARLLTNAGARAGDVLLLTKPLGTGVLINAFKFDRLDEAGLEPALLEMERLNSAAARLALAAGARAATDVTGFGLAGHALGMARASAAGLRISFRDLPVHERFYDLVARGITTGCTAGNRGHAQESVHDTAGLGAAQEELLFDPQTSGGLLVAIHPEAAGGLLDEFLRSGHRAARIGEVLAGPPILEIV